MLATGGKLSCGRTGPPRSFGALRGGGQLQNENGSVADWCSYIMAGILASKHNARSAILTLNYSMHCNVYTYTWDCV